MNNIRTGDKTLIGNMLIGKDAEGNYGNLTVQGTITAESIIAESQSGYNYATTIQGDGHTTFFVIDHNLETIAVDVTMLDSQGNFCIADVKVVTKNRINITFVNPPLIGTTYWIGIRK